MAVNLFLSLRELLVYIICLFGFCFIIGHSGITLKGRTWLAKRSEYLTELIECPACLSWWVGLLIGGFNPAYANSLIGCSEVTHIAATAFALFSCGCSAIIGLATGLITHKEEEDNGKG